MLVDLHLHTFYSDGTDSPEAILRQAELNNLRVIAIADHGCLRAYEDIKEIETPVAVIPALEINCASGLGEAHILGYYVDPDHPDLRELVHENQRFRLRRAYDMIRQLNRHENLNLSIDRLHELFPRTISFGKPHVARLIVDAGHTRSLTESYRYYLDQGKSGYVQRHQVSAQRACDVIRHSGGLAFLAHPLELKFPADGVRVLKQMGIQGMECYYSTYSESDIRELLAIARANHLWVCGGTDYHGEMKTVKFTGVDIPISLLNEWVRLNLYTC